MGTLPAVMLTVGTSSLSTSDHFPDRCHLNSIRYHRFFPSTGLTCPPVEHASASYRSTCSCARHTVWSVGVTGVGATLTIVESSTKQCPTSLKAVFNMQHQKAASKPAFWRLLRIAVLTRTHVQGAQPLPCPKPCGG
eukprot:3322489-Ditylum_brightwellii.AAC.1